MTAERIHIRVFLLDHPCLLLPPVIFFKNMKNRRAAGADGDTCFVWQRQRPGAFQEGVFRVH